MRTKQKVKPVRMTRDRRLAELAAFVEICRTTLRDEGPDDKEIANLTGLSVSTLQRLWSSRFSLAVRFGTIQALGIAAGYSLELTESTVTMRIVET